MTVLYIQFSHFINCTYGDLGCLMNKSTEEIINAQMKSELRISSLKILEYFEPWAPWLDGEIIKGQLLDIPQWIDDQQFPLKPFIIGTLTEECIISVYKEWTKPISKEAYLIVMYATLKGAALKVFDHYPPQSNSTDQRNLLSEFATRWIFSCSTRKFIETYMSYTRSNNNTYYLYVFDYPLDFDGWGNNLTSCKGHTCSGSDLPYTFDIPDANFTITGHTLALDHIKYWSNYAKFQSPNGNQTALKPSENLYFWPKYDSKFRNNLRFRSPENRIETNYLDTECDFLDSIGYYHDHSLTFN